MKNQLPRVGVYIDGANIFHGARDAGWMMDYAKLLAFIKRKFQVETIAYFNCTGFEFDKTGKRVRDINGEFALNKSQVSFHKKLEGMGFRVITKPLKFVLGNRSTAKNKMDSELVLTAYKELSTWDELLLFTGDCDFESLVTEMAALGKRVHIFSFKRKASYELRRKALTSPLVTFTPIDDLKSLLEKLPAP